MGIVRCEKARNVSNIMYQAYRSYFNYKDFSTANRSEKNSPPELFELFEFQFFLFSPRCSALISCWIICCFHSMRYCYNNSKKGKQNYSSQKDSISCIRPRSLRFVSIFQLTKLYKCTWSFYESPFQENLGFFERYPVDINDNREKARKGRVKGEGEVGGVLFVTSRRLH